MFARGIVIFYLCLRIFSIAFSLPLRLGIRFKVHGHWRPLFVAEAGVRVVI